MRRHEGPSPHPTPPSYSFSGCAWLAAYHFGVARTIQRHTDPAHATFLGASSGSIAAVVLATGVDAEGAYLHLLDFACHASRRRFGPVGHMTRYVRSGLEAMVPEDGHARAGTRLRISVTELPGVKNRLLPEAPLPSREALIRLVLASCYIPFYYERPAFLGRRPAVDGGLTDNQPVLDERTVRVSPFPLRRPRLIDVCPPRGKRPPLGLFPSPRVLEGLHEDGLADGEAFFERWRRLAARTPQVGEPRGGGCSDAAGGTATGRRSAVGAAFDGARVRSPGVRAGGGASAIRGEG